MRRRREDRRRWEEDRRRWRTGGGGRTGEKPDKMEQRHPEAV